MLLADVTLNSNKTQKIGLKKTKSAEKQNAQITDSENVNFKGGLATAVKLSRMTAPPATVKRSALEILPKLTVASDELKAFLDAHPDVFLGLEFTKMGDKYVSQKIDSAIAAQVVDDYTDKVNTALATAAQQAVPSQNGIKIFLTNLLTLRTKKFPFDVQHAYGRIHLTTYQKEGSFFLDPANETDFLSQLNPKFYDYLLESGLEEPTKTFLISGKNYQLKFITDSIDAAIDGNPFAPEAKMLKGIKYQEQI